MQKDSGAGKKKGMLYEEIILSGNSYARQNKTSNYLFAALLVITGSVILIASIFQQPEAQEVQTSEEEESLEEEEVPERNWEQTTSLEESSGDCITDTLQQSEEWNLVLVNPKIKLPDSYLESSVIIEAFDMQMDSRLKEPYEALYKAATADGMNLWISSCYRSQELQQELFEREIANNISSGMSSEQAESAAEVAVARPGYSEHNTGLAIDFNGVSPDFKDTEEYQWLQEHAAEYGFILRYPEGKEAITHIMYEPWHYRYVGVTHAKKMKELGMCLEEYLYYLQTGKKLNS